MSGLTNARRHGRTCPEEQHSKVRWGTKIILRCFCPTEHEQEWQPYLVDPCSFTGTIHTYLHMYGHAHIIARVWINRVRLQVLLVVS